MILGPDLVELICGGVAVLVSTRDSDLQPEIVRAWGLDVSADGSSLMLCVPAAPGSRTAANLESNGEVAALFVSSTDYRAIQVKGRAESLTAPTPEQLQLIEQHVLVRLIDPEISHSVGNPLDERAPASPSRLPRSGRAFGLNDLDLGVADE